MTSIVVSLYFKQENCETLISLYNWGRMKRCQSELVSCKVKWFCSLAVFSWWPGSLYLYLSLSVCLFSCSLSALCSSLSWKAEKRLYLRGPGGEACIIRASTVANYSECMLTTCCMQSGYGKPAVGSNHQQALPPWQLLVFTADQQNTLCICCLFA